MDSKAPIDLVKVEGVKFSQANAMTASFWYKGYMESDLANGGTLVTFSHQTNGIVYHITRALLKLTVLVGPGPTSFTSVDVLQDFTDSSKWTIITFSVINQGSLAMDLFITLTNEDESKYFHEMFSNTLLDPSNTHPDDSGASNSYVLSFGEGFTAGHIGSIQISDLPMTRSH